MAAALAPPVLVAALVVGLAAVAKLRAPAAAAEALLTLGVPGLRQAGREGLIRCLALGELALAATVLTGAAAGPRAALGALYVLFAAITLALSRRDAECGCFGGPGAPASRLGAGLNLAFAAVCLVGAAVGSPGARVFELPAWEVPIAVLSIVAAAAAAVAAYTELPRAWQAWGGG